MRLPGLTYGNQPVMYSLNSQVWVLRYLKGLGRGFGVSSIWTWSLSRNLKSCSWSGLY